MAHPLSGATAISGFGMTPMGRIYGKSSTDFAVDAIRAAIADAGLEKDDVDGLLINSGITGFTGGGINIGLQDSLGMKNLHLLNHMSGAGSTASQMVQYAAMSIVAGTVNHVVCVFADAPLRQNRSASAAYGMARGPEKRVTGLGGLTKSAGIYGANTGYALAARRHMELYGTKQDQLGIIAVGQREWASRNPAAQMRDPITMEDYHASRWIVEPLHLLDCCLVSNGAVAVIVSSAEAARDMPQPPVYIRGWGQGHPGNDPRHGASFETETGARMSGETAFRMAGLGPDDITQCQLYDCYTYTVLVTLEDYGFCKKGEGGPFVEDGKLGPGGRLPTNTGGGQLSGYYMWGMTPLSEGVIQARGHGGDRQAPNDAVLVSGNGGMLSYHGTLILSPRAN